MSGVTLRFAMWSGPRNISTAMMRAWENRPDTIVVDEPFYACYLEETGIDHPMRDAVVASQSTDWSIVARQLSEEPCEAAIYYQKHMTHHLLPHVDLDWTRHLRHCFLVRDPCEVVSSYAQKRGTVTVEDIGITRQLELYEQISDITGEIIPVLDAKQVLIDPAATLSSLCQKLGVAFCDEMLHWPRGRRDSDGVWAPHWYEAVERSTGFEAYREREISLTPEQRRVVEESEDAYRMLCEKGGLG